MKRKEQMKLTAPQTPGSALYETSSLVSQYLGFHYGPPVLGVPNFPAACIDYLMESIQFESRDRCLDIGCAVGRSSFELAKHFQHVDALDYSSGFIDAAKKLQQSGTIQYKIPTEGQLSTDCQTSLESLISSTIANRVTFQTGDACNLLDEMNNYDLVFAGNLIDRLYQPQLFLDSITQRIRAGGWLVITSPYTWLEDYTPPSYWLGGYIDNTGIPIDTFTGLSKALHPHFKLGGREDIPFVIRETGRKHQHTIAELTAWHRVE